MNAQEAIERVEWIIEQHKQMQMFFADKTDAKQIERYESLEKDIRAFSIALESAKVLHSEGINPDTTSNGVLVIERFISEKDFEKLGIEEGAEE